ncbi:MAG TPA: hypothetical protein VGO93_13535 [Candidatus Xenobia bacterium]|jgi:glycosyltransferase involved in cell wall biosynthesis
MTVVLGCLEVPGWGGASTSAYQLYQVLRNRGVDVRYVNLIDESQRDFFRYTFGSDMGNPRHLPSVHNCCLQGPMYGEHPELGRLLSELQPTVILGVGFIAALLLRRASPSTPSVLLTTGCQQMKDALVERQVHDFIQHEATLRHSMLRPRISTPEEREAVALSDLVLTHSPSTQFLYQTYFKVYSGKIHPQVFWFADWIVAEATAYADRQRAFEARDVDVLVVSSDWHRPEKNYPMVGRLVAQTPHLAWHVVGEVEHPVRGAVQHGVLGRTELFELMGRSRAVLSTSAFDAAPGILFEAAVMGCNVVASRNCGNHRLCHPDLLVEPYEDDSYVACIQRAVARKYNDSLNTFIGSSAVDDLVDILEVL